MDAAIPIQTATHSHSAVDELIDILESHLYNGGSHANPKWSPLTSRTRCTNKNPHIDAGSHFVRENTKFRAIPNVQTSPVHSSSTAICHRCLSHYNCVDHRGNQQDGCGHYNAICTPEFNFTIEDAVVKAGPLAQTRFPTSTPGATLGEKT